MHTDGHVGSYGWIGEGLTTNSYGTHSPWTRDSDDTYHVNLGGYININDVGGILIPYDYIRSPDTDVNDDAYWVVSSGNVGFGDGVNYDSYGKNHSPGTGNSNSACNVHMSSGGGTFSMDRSYGIISLSASS